MFTHSFSKVGTKKVKHNFKFTKFIRQHITILYSVEYPHCTDPIMTKEPKLSHLTSWLSSVKAEWREIGLSLHARDSELETFYRDRGLSDANRLSKTVRVEENIVFTIHV